MSTYVDNLFTAGRSCYGVTSILDDAETFLLSHWGLAIKASSREVMAPLRAADTSVTEESKWPVVRTMRVLVHFYSTTVLPTFVLTRQSSSAGGLSFAIA